MNLFSEIEGLRGEQLATAVLRVLILRSQDLRDALLRILGQASPSAAHPIAVASHFSCYCELPTKGEDSTAEGRIDLIIETDNAVVGIESKLGAEMQRDQPTKYLPTLRCLATQLTDARNRTVQPFLFVLCPELRRPDIEERMGATGEVSTIAWEEVRESFECVERIPGRLDQATVAMLQEFRTFMEDQIDFLPKHKEHVPYLKHWVPYGSRLHRELLHRTWRFLTHASPRLGVGKTWVGYYFDETFSQYRAWYGFVRGDLVNLGPEQPAPHEAVLVVITTYPVTPEGVTAGRMLVPWIGRSGLDAWAIDFGSESSTPEWWRGLLAQFVSPGEA